MKTIERVMRVMTHINIGATLGTGAWILVSGLQVVGGEFPAPTQHHAPATTSPHRHDPAQPVCCTVPAESLAPPSVRVEAPPAQRLARFDGDLR